MSAIKLEARRGVARPAVGLEDRISDALRKAFAREDRHLRGVPLATVQAMLHRGLVQVSARGRYERHVLSLDGERRAAELTRGLLSRRGDPTLPPLDDVPEDVQGKVAFHDRLVDFLVGLSDPSASSVTVDLPVGGQVGPGCRVKLDRCGPSKFVLSVVRPAKATDG